jgi:hypothetical protein
VSGPESGADGAQDGGSRPDSTIPPGDASRDAMIPPADAIEAAPPADAADSGRPHEGGACGPAPVKHRPGSTCAIPPDAGPFGPDGGPIAISAQATGCGTCNFPSSPSCELGTDGRCIQGGVGCQYCGYDTCFSDTQCESDAGCACDPTYGNACLPGNCRVDSDCACGFCSPSPDTMTCIPVFGNEQATGLYCHTPSDLCANDSDCGDAGGGVCAWQPQVGYWACAYAMCAG